MCQQGTGTPVNRSPVNARTRPRISRRRAGKRPVSVFSQVLQSIIYFSSNLQDGPGGRAERGARFACDALMQHRMENLKHAQPKAGCTRLIWAQPLGVSNICNYQAARSAHNRPLRGLYSNKGKDPLGGVQKWLPKVPSERHLSPHSRSPSSTSTAPPSSAPPRPRRGPRLVPRL